MCDAGSAALGRDAAAQVRTEMPLLDDERVDGYIAGIDRKLAAAMPAQHRHPECHFTFQVVNQEEINAFALAGGPMFLNRGMLEAAHSEGEAVNGYGAARGR